MQSPSDHRPGPPHEGDAHLNGVRLRYSDWNFTDGDTVVLLHGLNVQRHTWDPIAERLAAQHRVVSVDLRGHGDSGWARDGYHLSSFVDDIAKLIDLLNCGNAHVVGHSLGARIAIGLAAEHSALVRRMVLSDSGPQVTAQAAKQIRRAMEMTLNPRGFESTESALHYFRNSFPDWEPQFVNLHARHQVARNWAGQFSYRADPELWWRTTPDLARLETAYLWSALGRITSPTLLLAATRGFLDASLVNRMRLAMPSLEVEWIEASHYIPRERSEVFIAHVVPHLGLAPSPGDP